MIRIATIEDLDLIYSMAKEFAKQSPYTEFVNYDYLLEMIKDFINSPNEDKIILLNADKGMLAAMVTPFMFGNVILGVEVAWWVSPEHRNSNVGKELIEAFEFWAKKVGCHSTTLACMDIDLEKFYQKRGYTKYESVYMKELV
jgi:GNAT superfamily N-acetyltransferase